MSDAIRLMILRHAPLARPGLAGRRDVAADCSDGAAMDWAARALNGADACWASPALRCRQTCAALGLVPEYHADLWEQDFGAWEEPGASPPDLGLLPVRDLAAHRPPGGESFLDMAARVQPVLNRARGNTAIIAHAGTARAALALAVGPAALSFSVAPLSLTVMTRAGDIWAIEAVNRISP
ncbi:alpha-ribazole phosphatase [Paracoccus halophilus]|uniref:Alpha-ribazole phosphatase n=1 Tax=Paracoccus halophilus TaxID=376733 RepID=A0A099F0P2_9RHOB|nr:histidine phosphatase family protein [Paracoccus halophilus]KGJ03999.1 phosphoglycerate mutase [Paracoccus halophilus]SFA44591.1 alpha-ribazole phosphatase [Paracoccus halophilus]